MKHRNLGIGLAVLTAGISGCSIFYNKVVAIQGIDSLVFNILKNGGVALILTAILAGTNRLPQLRSLGSRNWKKLLAVGLIGGGIPFWLFFEGLKSVPAGNANIIQKSLFIWVALLAVPFLKEKLNRWQIAGYLAILWSNVLFGFQGFTGSRGEWMILSATMLWSVENVIAAYALRELPGTVVAWSRMFFGTVFLLAAAAVTGKLSLLAAVPPAQLPAIAGSILFLSGYVLSWYTALKYAPATVVTAVLVLATPITSLLSAVFLSQAITVMQGIIMGASVTGVIVVALSARRRLSADAAALS